MVKEDIDKLQRTITDGIEVYEDVIEAKKSDDKITIAEGGLLVVKHAGKAVRFMSAIPEIAKEIKDVDGTETSLVVQQLAAEFGGSDEAIEAFEDIAIGAGYMNQGIQKLVELKKAK
jgi:hypothetical protein